MFNQPPSPENAPQIERQEMVNRLKDYGYENPTTKELFGRWIDQLQAHAKTITDQEAYRQELLICALEEVDLFMDGQCWQEAWDSASEAGQLARKMGKDDICNLLYEKMDKIETFL